MSRKLPMLERKHDKNSAQSLYLWSKMPLPFSSPKSLFNVSSRTFPAVQEWDACILLVMPFACEKKPGEISRF